jgi:hypothetical protein
MSRRLPASIVLRRDPATGRECCPTLDEAARLPAATLDAIHAYLEEQLAAHLEAERATAVAERAAAEAERATAEAERATAEAERATAEAERATAEASARPPRPSAAGPRCAARFSACCLCAASNPLSKSAP